MVAASAWLRIDTFARPRVPGRSRADHVIVGGLTRDAIRWRKPAEALGRSVPTEAKVRPDACPPPPAGPGTAECAGEPQWYNDWRQIPVPQPDAFVPSRPVSVVVSHGVSHGTPPGALECTLAALGGQTWPRDLFEVVIVHCGASAPPASAPGTRLDVKVVRVPEDPEGARSRNAGARAAACDVVLFLDAGMLPEADWLAAHARWHHAVSDALTLGLQARVSLHGIGAGEVRTRPGSLAELLAGRRVAPSWNERYLRRTADLTSKADDPFRAVAGASIGFDRRFLELTGGFDESCAPRALQDIELGYRVHVRGGLLVPLRDAVVFHGGGRGTAGACRGDRPHRYREKGAHLVAHRSFRMGFAGRSFEVPQFVVTIDARGMAAEAARVAAERVLAGPVRDMAVRLETDASPDAVRWLRRRLGRDPRVHVASEGLSLDAFPVSPFHVTLSGVARWRDGVVRRLRGCLGDAVLARSTLPGGARASIVRAWALHRARRTPWGVHDFGEVVTIPPRELAPAAPRTAPRRAPGTVTGARPVRWRAPSRWHRSDEAPAVEVLALGVRARAVFAASRHVARTVNGGRVDVVVADTAAEAAHVEAPAVVLSRAPALLSVPAFDPRVHNPAGWQRRGARGVAALGPLELLPPGSEADRVVPSEEHGGTRWIPPTRQVYLRSVRHLEDVRAFHRDTVTRAAELVRLAAAGLVVHLADGAAELAPFLGRELFGLMTTGVRDLDAAGREALSVRMRRAALRDHCLGSRVRQVAARVLAEPPRLPLVSMIVVTRCPERLDRTLDAVRRQSWPRLELVLGLLGAGFGEIGFKPAGPSVAVTVLRLDAGIPRGAALDAASRASRGRFVTVIDDGCVYGREHVWDLVLAQAYSGAALVGKGAEFAYLAGADRTVRCPTGGAEQYETVGSPVSPSARMVVRRMLERTGGWGRIGPDAGGALVEAVVRAGGRVYRTHPFGFMRVCGGVADNADGSHPVGRAERIEPGWHPDLAGIEEAPPPPP